MKCNVYRSDKKPETYLYLAAEQEFDDLPDELQQYFGTPALVMELECRPGMKLARADANRVMAELESQGFYLQLPPKVTVEEEISRRFC
jgi:uncharacterized protein YcgL (UPF0745 family)